MDTKKTNASQQHKQNEKQNIVNRYSSSQTMEKNKYFQGSSGSLCTDIIHKQTSYSSLHRLSKTLEKGQSTSLNYLMKGKKSVNGRQALKQFSSNTNPLQNKANIDDELESFGQKEQERNRLIQSNNGKRGSKSSVLSQSANKFKQERNIAMSRRHDQMRSQKQKEIQEYETEIQSLRQKVSSLEDQLVEVEKQKIDLESSIKLMTKRYDLEITQLKEGWKEVNLIKLEHEQQIQKVKKSYQENEIFELKVKIEQLKAQLVIKNTHNVCSISRASQMSQKSACFQQLPKQGEKSRVDGSQAKITDKLKQQNQQLLEKLAIIQETLKSTKQKKQQIEQNLLNLQIKLNSSQSECLSMKQKMLQQNKEVKKLTQDLKNSQKCSFQTRQSLKRAEVALKEAEQDKKQLQKKYNQSKDKLHNIPSKKLTQPQINSQILFKSQRVSTMERMLHEKESQLKSVNLQIRAKDQQIYEIKKQLEHYKLTAKDLERNVLQMEHQIYTLKSFQLDSLKYKDDQIYSRQTLERQAHTRIKRKQEQIQELTQKCEKLQYQLKLQDRTVHQLEAKKQSMQMAIRDSKEQLNTLAASNAYLERINLAQIKQIENYKNMLSESERSKDSILKQMHFMERKNADNLKRVQDLREQNEKCLEAIRKVNIQKADLDRQVKNLQQKSKSTSSHLIGQKAILQDENYRIKKQLKSYQQKMNKQQYSFKTMQSSFKETQVELKCLQKRVLNKNIVEEQLTKAQSRIKGFQQQIRELQKQISSKSIIIKQLEEQLRQKSTKLKTTKNQLIEKESIVKQQRTKIQRHTHQIRDLEEFEKQYQKQRKLNLKLQIQIQQDKLKRQRESSNISNDWKQKYDNLYCSYTQLSQKHQKIKSAMLRSRSKHTQQKTIISSSYRYNQEILDHCQELLMDSTARRKSVCRISNDHCSSHIGSKRTSLHAIQTKNKDNFKQRNYQNMSTKLLEEHKGGNKYIIRELSRASIRDRRVTLNDSQLRRNFNREDDEGQARAGKQGKPLAQNRSSKELNAITSNIRQIQDIEQLISKQKKKNSVNYENVFTGIEIEKK